MSGTSIAVKTASALARRLKGWLDPNVGIKESRDAYILEEFPRIIRLIEELEAEIDAAGCSHEEAAIIAYQVLETQRQTIDPEKRKRLSNVLVNGLSAERWDKAEHRLMVRLAGELEEEHIHRLSREHRTHEQRERDNQAYLDRESEYERASYAERQQLQRRYDTRRAVSKGIERELIARGLLEEETTQTQNPSWKAPTMKVDLRSGEVRADGHLRGVKAVPQFVEQTRIKNSALGTRFLGYLADPEARSDDGADR